MMKTLTIPVDEPADRRVRTKWLKQLNERPTQRDHRLVHALLGYLLPIERFHPISVAVGGECCVEVVHCDPDVVQVYQLHIVRLLRDAVDVIRRPVAFGYLEVS